MAQNLIIFDIDNTLIYGTKGPEKESDFTFEGYHFYIRPYAKELLEFCRNYFQIAFWTSALPEYANAVINKLYPQGKPLFIWTRERCTPRQDQQTFTEVYRKNLNKVRRFGFNLDQVILVDDSPEVARKQPQNLLQVSSFHGEPGDQELRRLHELLQMGRNQRIPLLDIMSSWKKTV